MVMKADDNQIKEIDEFMKLFYRIVKNTFNPEQNQKYWDELVSACSYVEKHCEGSEFAYAMLLAYTNWQDLRSKGMTRVDGVKMPITQITEPDPWSANK